MAETRRSIRIPNIASLEPAEDEQPAVKAVVKKEKAKAPTSKKNRTQGAATSKGKAANSTAGQGKAVAGQARVNSGKDRISSLPAEVLSMTVNNIKDPSTMSALGRTSKYFYSLMMPRLYGHITVSAMYHAQIPKLIRALEPYLTIAQKKKLKNEGKYKGQQEQYPSGLDEKAKPICPSYVRQMVVGSSNPGRKHKYIVDRYVEEAFKNMNNLEIVEAWIFTKSMAECLASLKHIKAVRLYGYDDFKPEDIEPLCKIKDLKHLSLYNLPFPGISENYNTMQSMLINSALTLQSLAVEGYLSSDNLFQVLEKATKNAASEIFVFTALKSLSLSTMEIDADVVKSLQKAIDFTKLRELVLGYMRDNDGLLYQHLTNLFSKEYKGTDFSLRTLSLNMSEDDFMFTSEQKKAKFKAKCRLVASFNTLTSLELTDCGEYDAGIDINPGLSPVLLQAILQHKNLRTLKISYAMVSSSRKNPSLSATTVQALVDGLLRLEELEFWPEEKQMAEIARALTRATNLTSINCFPHTSWSTRPAPDEQGLNILTNILRAALSHASHAETTEAKPFVWEDHYKLKRVSFRHTTWGIASEFEKGEKWMKKPKQMTSDDDVEQKRVVLFRDIPWGSRPPIHVPRFEFRWVDKVDWDFG